MELRNRVFAGGCAVVALIALLVPQPMSWILMALLCVAFTVGTIRVRAGRWSQLFGLGLSLAIPKLFFSILIALSKCSKSDMISSGPLEPNVPPISSK